MASMGWKRLQDPQLQKRLHTRAKILALVREFFIKEGFLEVETPILVPAAGQEPHLDPMKVQFQAPPRMPGDPSAAPQDDRLLDGHLITSPEYAHKKLLAAGFEKMFEITRAFRAGESWGGLHNPEFTILEWYRARADYTAIMRDVEALIQYIWHDIRSVPHGKSEIRNPKSETNQKSKHPISSLEYQGKAIDLSSPWQRLTVREAFKQYAQVNLDEVKEEEEFFKIFLTHIEPKLGFPKPTILYEYPASMAALAKLKDSSPPPQSSPIKGEEEKTDSPPLVGGVRGGGHNADKVAERFEVYIAGIELANAFSELNDAAEQRRRFFKEQKLRTKLGKEIIPLDEDFLDAVGHMPPSAGIALGVDRLVMLFTNAARIEDVLAFPAGELFENA